MNIQYGVGVFHILRPQITVLNRCNGTVTKLQLCFLGSEYDNSFLVEEQDQGKIWSSVQIFEISEFDETQQTITLDLVLSVWWYDQRLALESNKPEQYVTCIQLIHFKKKLTELAGFLGNSGKFWDTRKLWMILG